MNNKSVKKKKEIQCLIKVENHFYYVGPVKLLKPEFLCNYELHIIQNYNPIISAIR